MTAAELAVRGLIALSGVAAAGLAVAALPVGGAAGVHARPGGPPPAVRPPAAVPPHHGTYPVAVRTHGYGPSVRFYYGGPYWVGWGWPGYYWPVPYASGPYSYRYYYGPGYGYLPPYQVDGPPVVVTSTGGVVYIEREAGTGAARPAATPAATSAATPAPAPAVAPAAAPAAAPAPAPPPPGQWWYLCSSPRGAYPYVRECPGGWERVPAAPPEGAR